ncbi:short transient receptor potential channel 7-like [Biomphalaria glabrata]|uniref:Short transient receptor potential channel 7-like n=1 Tax=Biomphalaria glabrata TaxID=6526 RepID=A0A9W3AUC2_BIOGL|nr:short transient receptor potential channel 7-like [Biomphalaria glabrata]
MSSEHLPHMASRSLHGSTLNIDHGQSDSLSPQVEDEFLHAVDFGDVAAVKDLLEKYPGLNVDCTDPLGRTPLRLAVKNENKELVELLLGLSSPDNMNEAVLQAIDSGATNIAEITLRHPRYLEASKRMRRMGDVEGFFKPERGSQFPSYVTPLILAAQKNEYPIVQLLLQRGESIIRPHKFGCGCQECINKQKFDQLRSAKCRLDAYMGLASEAYVSLYSKDPFLTAFELAQELRQLADSEVFFKKEYTDLADKLSNYVVKLLDRVWTHRELSAVLDKCGAPQDDVYESLSRFKMAVELEEKLFVAHPNCQQRIERCWYEGLEKYTHQTWPKILALTALFILGYPVIVGYFLVAPKSKAGRLLNVPIVKFVSHAISFFVYLILIIISCIEQMELTSNENTLKIRYNQTVYRVYHELIKKDKYHLYGEDFPLRNFDPTVSEIMIILWIIAMLIQECQELWAQGFKSHLSDKFNILDFMLLSVYIATYTLKYFCLYKFKKSVVALSHVEVLADSDAAFRHLYWMNADRINWDVMDPINTSEGLFAMANILSFSRISYLLRANEILGPLQISLGKMINDILKFFVFAAIVIIAFMVALNNLYWYYSYREDIEVDSNKIERPGAVDAYGSVMQTFRTVFWSIYGRGEEKAVGLGAYNNTMTEKIGETIDALYHISMIILLMNILIAMMTRTFEKTAEDADIEWKFARSALYLEYITKGRVLPVPFNILEVAHSLISHVIQIIRKRQPVEITITDVYSGARRAAITSMASNLPKQRAKPSTVETKIDEPPAGQGRFIPKLRSLKGWTLYQEVIQSIIQRFIYDVHRENETAGTDDVKGSFEQMRHEVMSQYKAKEESLNMAVNAIQFVSWQVSSLNGQVSEDSEQCPVFTWGRGDSVESQSSTTDINTSTSDLSVSYNEQHENILCDVHEEPDELDKPQPLVDQT